MIEGKGRVLAVGARSLEVELLQAGRCAGCSGRGCGHGLLARLYPRRSQRLEIDMDGARAADFRVGEYVSLQLSEALVVKASMLLYLAPLAGMIALAALGQRWPGGEGGAILGGMVGLLGVLALIRRSPHWGARSGIRPKLASSNSHRLAEPSASERGMQPSTATIR